MKVKFLDLRIASADEREKLLAAVDEVFRHGQFVLGPEVQEFETQMAAICGRTQAVGVGSGTDALCLALRGIGLQPGDEVITTSLSWIATANAIKSAGATPVFADILDDLTIDPASVEKLIGTRTRAIMPVHYTGKICRMEVLDDIARRHELAVAEDAAQAFGAVRYGRPAGAFGTIAAFSMNPMKVLAACGEAGVIVTDSAEISERIRVLRYNGTVNKETCIEPSLNSRLDTVQAAILLKRIASVPQIIERRRAIAETYGREMAGLVQCPSEDEGCRDAWYTYTIRTGRRDGLQAYLLERGIETKIQHPLLMPHQPAYRFTAISDIRNADIVVRQILCLPCHENMSEDQIAYVVSSIKGFFRT